MISCSLFLFKNPRMHLQLFFCSENWKVKYFYGEANNEVAAGGTGRTTTHNSDSVNEICNRILQSISGNISTSTMTGVWWLVFTRRSIEYLIWITMQIFQLAIIMIDILTLYDMKDNFMIDTFSFHRHGYDISTGNVGLS